MIYQGKARHPVREAILHCSAIPTGFFNGQRPFQVFATINRWHIERGFKSFGYHGLFMPDGEFYSGRPFDQIGAHCIGKNNGTLGFLLIESRKIDHALGMFDTWYTQAQRVALQEKLASIDGLTKVSGHNNYAPKLCPGFDVFTSDWL